MRGRQHHLHRLHEELGTIAVFDRIHDYETNLNRRDDGLYIYRQKRRAEILAEIEWLKAERPWFKIRPSVASAILLLCVVAYTTFRYLVK